MGCKCANKSEDEEKDEEILKKALEDGNRMDYINDGNNNPQKLDGDLLGLNDQQNQNDNNDINNLNENMNSRVTLEQLLQQVDRLESQIREVVDAVVSKRLPQELTDKFDLNISRKWDMSDEDIMNALWGGWWLEQWLNEGMDMWMSEWLWEAREMWWNPTIQWLWEVNMPLS